MFRKIWFFFYMLFATTPVWAAKLKINFASTQGLAVHAYSLDQFELYSHQHQRSLFLGDARSWAFAGDKLKLSIGKYRLKLVSQLSYHDQLEFEIKDQDQEVSVNTAYVYNFTSVPFPWRLNLSIGPGPAVQFWRRQGDPEFLALKSPHDQLGKIRERLSFSGRGDTVSLQGKRFYAHSFPKGLFILGPGTPKLNGIPLGGGKRIEDVVVYPTGVIKVNHGDGLVWGLKHLASGAYVTEFSTYESLNETDGTTSFNSRREFSVPVGQYLFTVGTEESLIEVKDGEIVVLGQPE